MENESRYLSMSIDELSALSDDKLFWAVLIRTESKVDQCDSLAEGINSLNEKQRIFYCVNYLDTEVNNGGLCQFFANSSRLVAPLMSEYLEIIGADEHKELYDGFVSKHSIDLNDLSEFDSDTVEEFTALYDLYPFDDFDNQYYEISPSIEESLTNYIKENIEDF